MQQIRTRATEQARRDPPGSRNNGGGGDSRNGEEQEGRFPGTLDANERD